MKWLLWHQKKIVPLSQRQTSVRRLERPEPWDESLCVSEPSLHVNSPADITMPVSGCLENSFTLPPFPLTVNSQLSTNILMTAAFYSQTVWPSSSKSYAFLSNIWTVPSLWTALPLRSGSLLQQPTENLIRYLSYCTHMSDFPWESFKNAGLHPRPTKLGSAFYDAPMNRMGFPGGASGKESACQHRRHKRHGFDPWVGKILWRRAWQSTPVFLPGESYGQRRLAGYSP